MPYSISYSWLCKCLSHTENDTNYDSSSRIFLWGSLKVRLDQKRRDLPWLQTELLTYTCSEKSFVLFEKKVQCWSQSKYFVHSNKAL